MRHSQLCRYRLFLLCLCIVIILALSQRLNAQDAELKIGVLYNHSQSLAMARGRDTLKSYSRAIIENGGRAIALLVTDEASTIMRKMKMLDGLLVPGGDDIDPKLYGEEPHPKLETVERGLDRFELEVLKMADRRQMPVLGICKGLQLMNVHRGGTMIQDIPSETQRSGRFQHRRPAGAEAKLATHAVNIESDSLLWQALQARRLLVPSVHHQAIEKLGEHLRVTARADDRIIEAIEATNHPFFVGVQFHPERALPTDPRFHGLFQALLTAAEGYRLTRKESHP
ncbi:MAG TPA: gamma-glutamyl-gamma-aminobutyrate hydrolase family protein [Candidatus Ozemobacteraceae bacterium]|nr:gamma-glutamyl-gamma-aminobutyrate hydrolase family protein [Candidatus Ozemobacteraceae bacterium]